MRPLPSLLRLALGSAATMSVLTACPGYTPPPPGPDLTFTFPSLTDTTNVMIAALAFEEQADKTLTPKMVAQNPVSGYGPGGPSNTTASLYYWGDAIASLPNNSKCTTSFTEGEASGKQEVTVTPSTVKTCNVYFLLYRDANRNGTSESGEVLYETHDLYSYATEAFAYRLVSPDGRSTETGTRTKGWSLVRHRVLQPSATPDRYLVTMNSVPQADETLPIRLHEATNYFTSQSLPGGHR